MSCPFTGKLSEDIKASVITDKANACPMIIRLAWHASGTFDKSNNTGGSDGASMRFAPESSDGANAGLSIARDILKPVKAKNPDVSNADIWTLAGAKAVEMMGGPKIPHSICRSDCNNKDMCPENGRLPDAALGAQHLRDVFYRMGFDDRDIVALSGAHTVGRCHLSRSGFDGPWTNTPLQFNNEYFRNLIELEWQKSDRTGPGGNEQYEDIATKKLMMLPTDIALKTDPSFKVFAEQYAKDQDLFFKDFTSAYQRLLALGCKKQPDFDAETEAKRLASEEFREQAMHGSKAKVIEAAAKADVHEVEGKSLRSALHKASYWGHTHLMDLLLKEHKINPNLQDSAGDTALHDAARFGHLDVAKALLENGADPKVKNNDGKTAMELAKEYEKSEIETLLSKL